MDTIPLHRCSLLEADSVNKSNIHKSSDLEISLNFAKLSSGNLLCLVHTLLYAVVSGTAV